MLVKLTPGLNPIKLLGELLGAEFSQVYGVRRLKKAPKTFIRVGLCVKRSFGGFQNIVWLRVLSFWED
jgi:hypothetical protein